MKIPKRVKIGGITYKVKEVDQINRLNNYDSKTVGLWKIENATIYIDKHLEQQIKEKFFLHELFHAIFEHCNIEQDENKVDLLSTALYMVVKDNPELFG